MPKPSELAQRAWAQALREKKARDLGGTPYNFVPETSEQEEWYRQHVNTSVMSDSYPTYFDANMAEKYPALIDALRKRDSLPPDSLVPPPMRKVPYKGYL